MRAPRAGRRESEMREKQLQRPRQGKEPAVTKEEKEVWWEPSEQGGSGVRCNIMGNQITDRKGFTLSLKNNESFRQW